MNVRERGRKPYVVDGSLDPALIPVFTKVLYIPGGDRRISEPSTVGKIPLWTPSPLVHPWIYVIESHASNEEGPLVVYVG